MFDKLLASVPYNPSMVHQLAFYGKRMREESSVRRAGVIMLVLAFLIQFFAVISPPQPTVADSSNDLINGGFSTVAQAAQTCIDNTDHYHEIMGYYGITCADLAHASIVNINSNDTQGGQKLYSMGHTSHGAVNSVTGQPTGEIQVDVPGRPTYVRYLQSFESVGNTRTYKALKLQSTGGGHTFYVLFDCGNLVTFGVPQPYTPPVAAAPAPLPDGTLSCHALTDNTVTLTVTYHNASDEHPVVLYNSKTVLATYTNGSHSFFYPNASLDAGVRYTYQLRSGISALSSITCTTTAPGVPPVVVPTPVTPTPVTPTAQPVCELDSSILKSDSRCVVCQYNPTVIKSDTACKSCTSGLSSTDTLACISRYKKAANITAHVEDANNTTAAAGDVITYTLYAKNNGKDTVKAFVFQEDISDTLDYATITDNHGSTIDSHNLLSWPAVDIKAGATASVQLTVTVKNPIVATPISSSDSTHFDLVMNNVYGNAVNIKLPAPAVKAVEIATTKLVNTGPGTSLFIGSVIVILAGYFYSRSRLLATESVIAVQENTSGGL